MATISEVEELNIRLVSDKMKVREEGIRLLNSYMDGSGGLSLCMLLDKQTAQFCHQERIPSSTWPGVLKALCQCIASEVAASKKRVPKLALAKTLRNFVQKAEDYNRSGKNLFLLRAVKTLFRHITEIILEVPTFVSDYSYILRQLLTVTEYCLHISKKVYSSLMIFFLDKVKAFLHGSATDNITQAKEEAFRHTLTLHCLLQNPPGDYPEQLREDTVHRLSEIFLHLRNEGRVAKKLLAALNVFLLNDGPNIGDLVVEIHSSIKKFIVHSWLTTHDRELKASLVLYIRIQLKLRTVITHDEGGFMAQIFELVEKELDQTYTAFSGIYRFDGGREEKIGTIPRVLRCFFELAASVLYEVGVTVAPEVSSEGKRQKKEHVFSVVKNRLMRGKWPWAGAFCLLIRYHYNGISKPVLMDWLQGLSCSLDRILGEGVSVHCFETAMWTLRCLQELSAVWSCIFHGKEPACRFSTVEDEYTGLWQAVWNCVLHWLPLFSSVQIMVEEAFKLSGYMITQGLLPVYAVPHGFWDVNLFAEIPLGSLLFFVAAYFSASADQITTGEDIDLRKKLLKWSISYMECQDNMHSHNQSCLDNILMLRCASILALSVGFISFSISSKQDHFHNAMYAPCLLGELPDWAELEGEAKIQENELGSLENSVHFLVAVGMQKAQQGSPGLLLRKSLLPFSISHSLLQELAGYLLQKISIVIEESEQQLIQCINMCNLVSVCIDGIANMTQRRGLELKDWCSEGRVLQAVFTLLGKCICILKDFINAPQEAHQQALLGPQHQILPEIITQALSTTLTRFLASPGCFALVSSDLLRSKEDNSSRFVLLLENLLLSILAAFETGNDMLEAAYKSSMYSTSPVSLSSCVQFAHLQGLAEDVRIIDSDLDAEKDMLISDVSVMGEKLDGSTLRGTGAPGINAYSQWRLNCVHIIASFAQHIPAKTADVLVDCLSIENDAKVHVEILLHLCKSLTYASKNHVPFVVNAICNGFKQSQDQESGRHCTLAAIDALIGSFLNSDMGSCNRTMPQVQGRIQQWNLSEKILHQLSNLVTEVSEKGCLLWTSRRMLAGVISNFILLDPNVAQGLTDKFLALLHDPDYRVRLFLSRNVTVLFQTWTGHEELLQDICCNLPLQMVMAAKDRVPAALDFASAGKAACQVVETVIVTLGELAVISEKVEDEVVFMICALASLYPSVRFLVCLIFDKLARRLHYPNRWKYLGHLLGAILARWVKARVPLAGLVEIRSILVHKSEAVDFLEHCSPLLLPSLFVYDCEDELIWLAKVVSKSVSALVKHHFASIFAAVLPMHCGNCESERKKAVAVLQGSILAAAQVSEDDRDDLIKKNMVFIVNSILQLCCAADNPHFPLFSKSTILSAIKTVVDGFLDSGNGSCSLGIVDKLQIFRPDRVFMFILQLHLQIESACHPRHQHRMLVGLGCLIDVIKHRVAVPTTCRYLIHILLQSIEIEELQEQCCCMLEAILDALSILSPEGSSKVLEDQLQPLASKLISCCINSHERSLNGANAVGSLSCILHLLERVTVCAESSLYTYVKELTPFPDLPCLESVRSFHSRLCAGRTFMDDFVKFVAKASDMPPQLRARSLQNLHSQLDGVQFRTSVREEINGWCCSDEVVSAAWRLVQICFENNAHDMYHIVGDFIAKVGIGDPHGVVFHLPDHNGCEAFSLLSSLQGHARDVSTDPDAGVHDNLIRVILLQLRRYLFDESAHIIELTSQSLKGLLSTGQGQRVFKMLSCDERVYLEVFSRGVNQNLVENLLSAARLESSKKYVPLEEYSVWQLFGKTYDTWVCELVYSLIHYSNDTILRLCQGLVYSKSVLAEVILPHVLGNLAATDGGSSNICKLISNQVEKYIFCEENTNTRSIQLFLDAMNDLRRCYVLSRMTVSEVTKKKESSKGGRSGSSGGSTTTGLVNNYISDAAVPVRSVLEIGNKISGDPSSWHKVYWLHVDYLKTAKAAQQCGAYFTSVLYVEHWCEENFGVLTLGEPDFSDSDELSAHVELLLTVSTRINEPDGVYGVVRSHKLMSQLLTYEHKGNWSRAVESYDLLLRSKHLISGGSSGRSFKNNRSVTRDFDATQCVALQSEKSYSEWKYNKGLMKSLQQTGCCHVLEMYSAGLAAQRVSVQQDGEFLELQYEAAWRAGKWDFLRMLPELTSSSHDLNKSNGSIHFHENLHSCLRSLREGDTELFFTRLKQAKEELVNSIAFISLESTQNIHPAIVKLQILNELSKSWNIRWRSERNQNTFDGNALDENQNMKISGPCVPSSDQVTQLDADWQHKLNQMRSHYDLLEPCVAFRKVLFQVLECQEHVPQHLLEFATLARKSGRLNQAANAIYELKLMWNERLKSTDVFDFKGRPKVPLSAVATVGKIEEAKILWGQDQHEMAVNLVKYIIQHYDIEGVSASLYSLTGKWLAESQSGSSHVILESYLKKAVELAEVEADKHLSKSMERVCQAHYRLAHYADSLYRSYEERLGSTEWQAALRLRQHKARELEELLKRLKISAEGHKRDYSMKVLELQKQLMMDNEEAQRLEGDRDSFLCIALDSYRCCLATGEKYDLRVVFRVISLWFNLSTTPSVVAAMLYAVQQVKSFKFLPLVYQIASRLGGSKDSQMPQRFQYALTYLVKRMAIEHPYHTIFQLLALANGDRVKDKQRSKSAFVVDMDKKHAAENLLNDLMTKHNNLIQQMKQMVEIYIKLAELEVRREDTNKRLTLPRDIRLIRQLELVPVITASIPVDPSCQYLQGSFPYFKGLSDRIIVMNGINAPKVVECLGSDGNKYRQLAKSGNDDLRQDAVMEQLFGLVNTLLHDHPDTWKRRLGIRTYKVVPFTPSAGVLEWVDRTVPLGEYLLGSTRTGGAHSRYGPRDWTFPMCREHMTIEKDKRKAFQKVCENFRPVMHFFFLEKFTQPAEWFEKRLAYTRSVAASSMVGYIVGLGDRHSMNILIDQASAEVIHIDLGVAFEQGLMLKTPERVPFRLTRDIVDGMGVTGVEGVFRRCCEETLSVMRANKEALLTIIEVFIHDPLYKWALSPLKALQRQKDTNELGDDDGDNDNTSDMESSEEVVEGNKDAARALLHVKQKLNGYGGGDMRSVQGQVQQLIQDAQDPERLCQLFPGWGAWL